MKFSSSIFPFYRGIVVLVCLWISVYAFSAWTPLIHNYNSKVYAAGTQNWDIAEHSNGWMYFANNYGLLEFDGSHWRLYGIENGTAVRSVALGNNGAVYVGGSDEFGVFLPNSMGELQYNKLSNKLSERYRHFGEVWNLQMEEDLLYVQTRHYIFICNNQGEIDVLDPGAIIYESVVWEGNLYVATSRDIYVYIGNRFHALRGSELLKDAVVCELLPFDKNNLLIATDFQGLFLYDGNGIRRFETSVDDYISANQLYAATKRNSKLVLGTVRAGVVMIDMDYPTESKQLTRLEGLQNNTVLSLIFDSLGYLWIGLDNGIDRVDCANPVHFYQDNEIDYGSGYSSVEHEGELYLGTNQGLYVNNNTHLTLIPGSQGQVWNVCKVGSTLFCCHNRGIFIVQDHKLQALDCSDGVWNIVPLDDSSAIVGTYVGFYYLSKRGKDWSMTYLNGFSETALYYTVDTNGDIWLLSSRGIECLKVDTLTHTVSSSLMVNQAAAQRHYSIIKYNNEIYLTGNDDFCTVSNGQIYSDSILSSAFSGPRKYLHIGEDSNKNRWFIYDNDRVAVQPFDKERGIYQAEQTVLYSSSLLIDGFPNISYPQSGGVIIGGVDGFYHLDVPPVASTNDDIYLRRIIGLDDSQSSVLYGESYNKNSHLHSSVIVNPSHRSLRVEFSGQYANSNDLLFRTRLKPLEENFTPWSQQAYRDFIGLPIGGNCTLEIEMMCAGTNQIYTRSIPVELLYPWYLSYWMKVAYVVLALLVIALIIRFFYKAFQRSKARLAEEKNAEIYQQQLRILQLENEKTQYQLRNKSQELSNFLLSEASRREWNDDVMTEIRRIIDNLNADRYTDAKAKLQHLQTRLAHSGEKGVDWKRFEENFDIVHNHFIARLTTLYPWLKKDERRLCVYIHMGLISKEIAPLLNISVRAVEMMRYRIRSKMNLPANISLNQHFLEIQSISSSSTQTTT